MKLLIDMNLSPKWVVFLEDAGFAAGHWSDLGPVSALDSEIMAFAKAGGWIIITNDLDFGAILAATGGNAPSVMQIRAEDLRIEAIGSVILRALATADDALRAGALVTIEADRTRLSVLPIGDQL